MSRKTLKAYTVNETVFNDILENMSSRIVYSDNIDDFYKGYKDKKTIYYDNHEYLICQEYILANFCEDFKEKYNDWVQCVVRLIPNQKEEYLHDLTGLDCWNYMWRFLKKYYTEEELKDILKSFKNERIESLKQFHYTYPDIAVADDIKGSKRFITVHKNCYKYDINGAHAYALTLMFPKAKKAIIKMHNERKQKPNNKKYINYFVGFLKHKGYEGAYNFIVQTTTYNLKTAINDCGGYLVYANTDGFVTSNPEKTLNVSNCLGDFKLEFQGTVYTHQNKNYWCFQTEKDEMPTGLILNEAKKQTDLRKGIITNYDIKVVGPKNKCFRKAENIKKEKVELWANEL